MSWEFFSGPGIASSPSTGSPATFSFWCWFKLDQASGGTVQTILREDGARIVLIASSASGFDDLQFTRSGMSGSIVCDMSANGITASNEWVFVGIAMSGFTTLDRFVLATESTEAFEATVTDTLSGSGFTASNVKSLGNSSVAAAPIDGLIHSAGFHTASLSLAQFETARTTFDQSTSADWTFLLNDDTAPFSVTAQSGSGDLTGTSVTHDADAPSFAAEPDPSGLSATGRPVTTLVDGRGFALRHIRPGTGEGAATVTLLGRSYGFEWLPSSSLPSSPDLVEGSYTRRINDAGEFELRFPNVASSKGLWRDKFSEAGALEFVELYRDGVLEFVGSIERVEIDRGVVTISGPDAWGLLKRAYERDRVWFDAPSTVIDAYTRVPLPVFTEQWEDLSAWTTVDGAPSVSGGILSIGDDTDGDLAIRATVDVSGDFTCEVVIPAQVADSEALIGVSLQNAAGTTNIFRVIAQVFDGDLIEPGLGSDGIFAPSAIPQDERIPLPTSLRLTRRGRWATLHAGGRICAALEGLTDDIERIAVTGTPLDDGEARIGAVTIVQESPLLRRGSSRGDAVLPGDLPSGGLRGRYHNTGDIQGYSAARRRANTLPPTGEPYAERLDGAIGFIGSPLPVMPGSDGDWFAVRWTGGVYLPLAGGQVEFRLEDVDAGARLWVGRTGADEALLERWNETAGTIGPETTALGSEDGWYPIRIDYYEAASDAIIALQYRRVASGWTDPGGTSITANTWTTVPTTSLSPLGCHEARIQGQSHFEIIKDAASQAGYELLCEPQSLESGEFPGRLVPRIRVGRDTDLVLEVEDRDDAEPILSPAVTRDSSDQAVRFIGSGAGNADGRGSQLLAEVVNLDADTLFELQAFADAGDARLPQLLEARLNAELALRSTPWQEVRGTPRGMERLADTWPLTGALSAMRWRPGDGLRISVPDIGVIDTAPRRITQVTRSFAAEGRTATTVGFRQRPRSASVALRRLARSMALNQRSNQGQQVTLTSEPIAGGVSAGSWTAYADVALLSQDTVRRAYVRVTQWTGTGSLDLEVNGTDRTSALGGAWATAPLEIDVTAYASAISDTDNRLRVRMQQDGGTAGAITMQLVVEVTR